MAFDQQHEINEIFDTSVGHTFARTRVSVQLLHPMLFGRERWNGGRRNASEAEPVVARQFFEWFNDFITDAEIDVEPHKRPAIEPRVHWESSATFWRLIKIEHDFANHKREEIGLRLHRRQLQSFAKGVGRASESPSVTRFDSDGQIQILCRPRLMEPQFERVAAFQNPRPARTRRVAEHARKQSIEGDLAAQTLEINTVTA